MNQQELRTKISELVAQYSELADSPKLFLAGETPVPPSGKVVGTKERQLMVEASLDAWLTTGRFNDAFQKRLGEYLGVTLISAMTVVLFFGGWMMPEPLDAWLPPFVWFVAKIFCFIMFFILLRTSLPRPRFDQLLSFGWLVMLPLALANLLVTALLKLTGVL